MKPLCLISIGVLCCALLGCSSPAPFATIPARQIETQKVTLGNVQMIVKKGASSADVISALSSPNIVTSNKDETETWVYDKIMTESETAHGNNGMVSVRSTRTMIVVIKFDREHRVETVQYRQTSY